MVRIALCDDDVNFSKALLTVIENYFLRKGMKHQIELFTNGNKLVELFKNQTTSFDVVFLDIEMPSINGKNLAKKLRLLDSTFKLIFISSHANEVFNCFEYDVLDFVPKNLVEENIHKTLSRLQQVLFLRTVDYHFFEIRLPYEKTEKIKVLIFDILYFESNNRKVYLTTKKETFQLHNISWNEIEKKYFEYDFIVPHRGYLVNLSFIERIKDTQIQLDNGCLLPLGRRNKKNVEQQLLKQMENVKIID